MFRLALLCAVCSCFFAGLAVALPTQVTLDVTCNLQWRPLDVFANPSNATITDTRVVTLHNRISTSGLLRFAARNFFAFNYAGSLASDFGLGLVTLTTSPTAGSSINVDGSVAMIAEKLSYQNSQYSETGTTARTLTVTIPTGGSAQLYILNLNCPGLNTDLDPLVDAISPLPGVQINLVVEWNMKYLNGVLMPFMNAPNSVSDFNVWAALRKLVNTDAMRDPFTRLLDFVTNIANINTAGLTDSYFWGWLKSSAQSSVARLQNTQLWWDELIQFCLAVGTAPVAPTVNSATWTSVGSACMTLLTSNIA